MSSQTQVSEAVATLINLTVERWGYYFGKRATASELMKSTIVERAKVREVGQKISGLFGQYLSEGKDVRADVGSLQGELAKARADLSAKSKPFYEKMRPLNKALSFLDKTAIPEAIELATGSKVTPRFQLSEYVLKAITPKAKK